MKRPKHFIQLLIIGSVTLGVAVWGSPAEAFAAATICKVLAAVAGTAGADAESDGGDR